MSSRSHFASNLTTAYSKAVHALRQLEMIEGLDRAQQAVADALAGPIRERWVKHNGLQESKVHVVHWSCLLGEKPDRACHNNWEDHRSLWEHEEKFSIYVSQPYVLELDDLREIVALCDKYDLKVIVSPEWSWHFPGRTFLIAVRPADTP